MVIDLNNIENLQIDKFYFEDINSIKILDVIKIDKSTVNKLDMIMFRYYPESSILNLIPLILSFNNLPDISNINIGTIIKIPDIDDLFANVIMLDDNSDNIVQGVGSLTKSFDNKNNSKNKNGHTTASPKLNITLKNVSYDAQSGIITY